MPTIYFKASNSAIMAKFVQRWSHYVLAPPRTYLLTVPCARLPLLDNGKGAVPKFWRPAIAFSFAMVRTSHQTRNH